MHGRQKVQQTVEEEQKKAKERSKKLSAYQNAMNQIFTKRSQNTLNMELLQITGHVLASNPDIGTLWNIRKETLLEMNKNADISFPELVSKDLELTEVCLRSNPKSYGAWHHRCWLMQETKFERVVEELKLCAKYLKLDDRNFHCWDYRRYLLDNSSSMSLDEELTFTTEKIISNFSNYSSWHLRSTILPKVSNTFLLHELDLIKNAAFTDPNDQSVWFYYRWLLKSQFTEETPKLVFAYQGEQKGSPALLCVFNIPVPNPSGLITELNDGILTFSSYAFQTDDWSNPWNNSRSKLWALDLRNQLAPSDVEPVIAKCNEFPKYFDVETSPKSSEFEVLLRNELDWVSELNELEPDNKWILATLILLMRLIDYRGFKIEISDNLSKLITLDPNRTNYYLDLRSKYIMEWKLVDLSTDIEEIDLSNLGLTSAYYLERLCAVKVVNLSGNQFHEFNKSGSGQKTVASRSRSRIIRFVKNIPNEDDLSLISFFCLTFSEWKSGLGESNYFYNIPS